MFVWDIKSLASHAGQISSISEFAWNFWILCINLASTYISISIFTIMQVVSNAYFGEAFCTKTVSRCQHLNRDSNHQLAAYKLVALTAGLCLSQVVHCEFLAACTNIAG